jgi:hypothetical protein
MATTKITVKGTCGACFLPMALDVDGRVKRHDWREPGVRRAAVYGNADHHGPCFGSNRLPFELSPDCTVAFVADVLLPMALDTGAQLDALDAQAALRDAAAQELTKRRDYIASDAAYCLRAIETWALAEVVTVKKKPRLVHARGSYRGFTACARRITSFYANRAVTENADAATCPKCLASLAKKSAATA